MWYDDEPEDRCATNNEALAEYARNAGMDNPDRAWLLTDWDVWVANPFYKGSPVRHPEADDYDYEEAYDDPHLMHDDEAAAFSSARRGVQQDAHVYAFYNHNAPPCDIDDLPF